MNITPPADDYGLQKLKQADSSREVKETNKLEPYPRIESTEERHEPKQPMVVLPRGEERRKGQDRRHAQEQTTLDTRDHHERRHQGRRQKDEERAPEEDASAGRGIDELV